MDAAITLQGVVTVGGFLLALFGAGFGLWKYFEGKIERTRSDAALATKALEIKADSTVQELAAHKLHVAETYTTKAGMAEQTAQIMKALDGVSAKIDYTNQRLDSWTTPTANRLGT